MASWLRRNARRLSLVIVAAILIAAVALVMRAVSSRSQRKELARMETTCVTSQDNAKILVLMYVHGSRTKAAARAAASFLGQAACPMRVVVAAYHVSNEETAEDFHDQVSAALGGSRYGSRIYSRDRLKVTHVPVAHDAGRLAALGLMAKRNALGYLFTMTVSDAAMALKDWDARFVELWRALPAAGDAHNLLVQNVDPVTQDLQYGTWTKDAYGMPVVAMKPLTRLQQDYIGSLDIAPAAAADNGPVAAHAERAARGYLPFEGRAAIMARGTPRVTALSLRNGFIAGPSAVFAKSAAFSTHVLSASPRYEAPWLSSVLYQEGYTPYLCMSPLIMAVPSSRVSTVPRSGGGLALAGLSVARRVGLQKSLQGLMKSFRGSMAPLRLPLEDSLQSHAATVPQYRAMQRAAQAVEASMTRAILFGMHEAGFSLSKEPERMEAFLDRQACATKHAAWLNHAGIMVQRAARVRANEPIAKITVTGRARMGLLPGEDIADVLSKFPNLEMYEQLKHHFRATAPQPPRFQPQLQSRTLPRAPSQQQLPQQLPQQQQQQLPQQLPKQQRQQRRASATERLHVTDAHEASLAARFRQARYGSHGIAP